MVKSSWSSLKFYLLLFVPEFNFKFLFTLESQIGPLFAGGCEKIVCVAEIQVTFDALR